MYCYSFVSAFDTTETRTIPGTCSSLSEHQRLLILICYRDDGSHTVLMWTMAYTHPQKLPSQAPWFCLAGGMIQSNDGGWGGEGGSKVTDYVN
jgi:hypothetical protein